MPVRHGSVVVERPLGDELSHQLVALYETFRGIKHDSLVEFDFSQLAWLYPMLILPLAAHESMTNSTHKEFSDSVRSYADVIQFPNGVDSVSELR